MTEPITEFLEMRKALRGRKGEVLQWAHDEIRRLQEELKHEKDAQCDACAENYHEMKRLREENEHWKEIAGRSQKSLEVQAEIDSDNTKLREQNEELRKVVDRLREENEQLRESIAKDATRLAESHREALTEIRRLREENEQLFARGQEEQEENARLRKVVDAAGMAYHHLPDCPTKRNLNKALRDLDEAEK